MKTRSRNSLYIDAANLIMTCRDLGIVYDLQFLLQYLKDRYRIKQCVYFTAKLQNLRQDYDLLQKMGVETVFKKIYFEGNKIKANCDVQIANRITQDVLENKIDNVFLLSGDGDFASLLDFVKEKNKQAYSIGVVSNKTSKLLKEKRKFNVTFLEEFLKRKGPTGHVASAGVLFDNVSIASETKMSSKGGLFNPEVLIGVKDLNKSKVFFENVFGLVFLEFRPPYAHAKLGALDFNIEEDTNYREVGWVVKNIGTRKNLSFKILDIENFKKIVLNNGGKIYADIALKNWGYKELIIQDLDDNEFIIEEKVLDFEINYEFEAGEYKHFTDNLDYPLKGVTFPTKYGCVKGYLGEDGDDLDVFVGTGNLFGYIKVSRLDVKVETKFCVNLTEDEFKKVVEVYKPVLVENKNLSQDEFIREVLKFKKI